MSIPDPIYNFTTSPGNQIIYLTFTPGNTYGYSITYFVVRYRTPPYTGGWTQYTQGGMYSQYVPVNAFITNLLAATQYEIEIATTTSQGTSSFTSAIGYTNGFYTSINLVAINLVATNVVSNTSSNGSIVLTWTQEASQNISYYVVEYKICEFGGWITYPSTITPPTTSIILSNLGPSSNIANNLPYLFRVYSVNSSGVQSNPSNIVIATSYNNSEPTRLWSRFNLNCSGNITSFDNLTRNMLRKAQVLQYPAVGTLQYSRASLWSMAAKNQLTRQKAWASESQEYTYPNITNINNQPDVGLKQTPTSLVCWTPPPSVICNSSTASDVPGNPTTLCFSKNAPFDNFRRPITYSSGGTKWPIFFSK